MIQFPNYSYEYQLLIKHILDRPLEWAPEQKIYYRDQVSYTYREFFQRIKKLANLYKSLDVEKGNVVAVMDYDSHRYLEHYFAVPMMGAILHTINIRLSPEQMLYTINHAEDKILVVHKDFEPLIQKLSGGFETVEKVIYIDEGDDSYVAPFDNVGEYDKLLATQPEDFDFPDFDEKTIATLFYTTGTTGNPKGVYFTHRQLVLHTVAEIAAFNAFEYPVSFNYTDVYMPLTPMFHVHAWGVPYVATMMGIKQIYPGRYDEMIVKLLVQHKVTFSHCVPTVLQMVIGNPATEKIDFSNWKVIIGGSALAKGLAQEAIKRNIRIMTGYGMSETAPILSLATFKPGMEENLSDEEKLQVVTKTGFPVPFVKMKVVNEKGEDLPWGKENVGEIVVRTPWLTKGYYKLDNKSKELWKDGWLHTGDIAYRDQDGYFVITDRLKDVIKTGGEWVSSLELESIINQCIAINQVAVIGVPDKKWGERPVAFVTYKSGFDETNAFSKCRMTMMTFVEAGIIEKWAIPDRFIALEEIPKTSVGKIDKKVLRQMYLEKYS